MKRLGVIFLYALTIMSCKQGELASGAAAEFSIMDQAEGFLNRYSDPSQADLSSNKKSSISDKSKILDKSKGDAKVKDLPKPSDGDLKVEDKKGDGEKAEGKKGQDKQEQDKQGKGEKLEDGGDKGKEHEDIKGKGDANIEKGGKDNKAHEKKDELQPKIKLAEPAQPPPPPVVKKTAQEAYAEFEDRVIKYKSQLINERKRFDPKYYALNIPFKMVSPFFVSAEQQSDIYAALGSDLGVVLELERIFNNLDLKYPPSYTYGDTKVADHLFNLLLKISDYTRNLVNIHLSSSNLERIKHTKSVEDIIALDALLENFIRVRDKAVKTVQDQITLLASKNKGEMLDGLCKTIGLKSGSDREIQHAAYSIIAMVARIAYLVK